MYEGQTQPQEASASPLLTFVAGAAIGASVMLLCAPKSGREARAQIADAANRVKETAGNWREKAITTAHDTLDQAAETLKSASDTVDFGQSK